VTILEACLTAVDQLLSVQIPKVYTHYAATALFFFFGFKTLYDVFFGEDDVSKTELMD
jgi:hypothetical protein